MPELNKDWPSILTEYEERERELILKIEELTDFVENASLPLHWVDGQGIIIWANRVELDLLGYSKEEYIGQSITRFHADQEIIEDILNRLTNNETLQNYPARLICKDGSIKHVLINSNVFRKNGEFIHTRCFTRDVTTLKQEEEKKAELLKELEIKNKKIEEQARELERRIQEGIAEFQLKNQQLNEAQEIAKMGSWEWDVTTNKVSWTKGLFRVYEIDYTPDGLTYEKFLEHIHPDDRAKVEDNIKQSFADKKFKRYFHRIVTPDGKIKTLEAKGEIILNEKNQIVRMIGTGQDVSEQKKVEQQLLIQTNQLREMNTELEKFAYIASHDLQEPLRKIKIFISRLANEYNKILPDERSRRYLSKIEDGASRMQHLLEDILNYSRLAQSSTAFQMVNLRTIVDEVLSDMEIIIDGNQAEIEVKNLGTIEANATQMRQLFQNLIGNAIKFRKPGTNPKVEISAKIITGKDLGSPEPMKTRYRFSGWDEHHYWMQEKFYKVMVKDFGIGIEPEFYERIFLPFERLHSADQYEGNGIGLAICRKIADYHHGKMTAESSAENGTVLSFTLPVSQSNFKRVSESI